jgi:hypothetical protein
MKDGTFIGTELKEIWAEYVDCIYLAQTSGELLWTQL